MLESIDVTDVVAIFANVDRSVDGRPKLRFIGGVDLIALELPRENLRVGPVVISKLEISTNSQGIYRAQRKPRENHVFGDGQVHASRPGAGRCSITSFGRDRSISMCARSQGELPRYAVGRSLPYNSVPGRCLETPARRGRKVKIAPAAAECQSGLALVVGWRTELRSAHQTIQDSASCHNGSG